MVQFKVLESNTIFSGYVFDVKVDKITYDGINHSPREVVIHNGGAVILPVLQNGNIIFVKQYRYPLGKYIIELPAGKLNKGEDPLLCATRELKEETGYTTNKIYKLGSIFTTPGFCTEELHLYAAEQLIPGDHQREEGERDMELLELNHAQIKEKIMNGEIKDAKTLSALMYYFYQKGLL
jgi:ADP-ribose pyrophosphatase